MKDKEKTVEQIKNEGVKGGQKTEAVDSFVEPTYEAEEPWLPIETKMVVGSLIAGMIALVLLAVLVHMFILGGQ